MAVVDFRLDINHNRINHCQSESVGQVGVPCSDTLLCLVCLAMRGCVMSDTETRGFWPSMCGALID